MKCLARLGMGGWARYRMMGRLRRTHTQTHYLSVSGGCSTSIFCIQPDGKLPYLIFHLIENPPKALARPRLPKSDSPLYSQSSRQRPYTGSHFLLLPSNTALDCRKVCGTGHQILESMEGLDQQQGRLPQTTQSKQGPTPPQLLNFEVKSSTIHRQLT